MRRAVVLSGKVYEKICRFYRKSYSKLNYVFEGHVPFSPLYATDVIAVKTGSFSQNLLRHAARFAQLADRGTETGSDCPRGHIPMFGM